MAFTLPLECITPVVGGGVESREPDQVDAVRIPGIRGQLRLWWRALQPESTAEALFEAETKLWGGVGLEPEETTKPNSHRSQVVLRVNVIDQGKELPAGRYQGEPGRYRALPEWAGGPAMGYGLFPLQLEREELNRHTIATPPTRSVRSGLRFDLEVTVNLPAEEKAARGRLTQVVGALWLWVHCGGIGSRTTRGFGALTLRGECAPVRWLLAEGAQQPDVLADHLHKLLELFKPRSSGELNRWLGDAADAFGQRARPDSVNGFHPRLPAKAIVHGPLRPTPQDALLDGLDNLKSFRQGPGVARTPNRPRPGRSYWPEADTLRRIAGRRRKVKFLTHPPIEPDNPRLNGAPRVAFGMPLNVPFKDQDDKPADGVFMPAYGERWTSPLRMRPLRCKEGCVSLLLYLNQPFPPDKEGDPNRPGTHAAAVLVKTQRPPWPELEEAVVIKSSGGAHEPIRAALEGAEGDAVQAFLEWLKNRGWKRVEIKP